MEATRVKLHSKRELPKNGFIKLFAWDRRSYFTLLISKVLSGKRRTILYSEQIFEEIFA